MDAATINLTFKEANTTITALYLAEMDAIEFGEPAIAAKISAIREKIHHQLKYKNINDK